MAGYRTVDELMQILDDEILMFDAFMSIIGGNNTYGHQVMFIPKIYITYKKEGVEIRYPGLNEPFFYPDDVPFDIRSGVFYFLKDGDSISLSVSLPDKSDPKMSEEEKERLVEQYCISDFLQNKGITTEESCPRFSKTDTGYIRKISGLRMSMNYTGILCWLRRMTYEKWRTKLNLKEINDLFFRTEKSLAYVCYNTTMDSKKKRFILIVLTFRFWHSQGSELTAGTFLYILYKRGVLA